MTIEEAKKMIGIREDQIWLLKAALCAPHEALPYWNQWKKKQQLENIGKEQANYTIFVNVDAESQRILPLIYRNLEHTQDPLLPALRDIYKDTWMRNQKLLSRAQQVVKSCNENKIPNMLLKGIPMSLLYYKDMGVRPMGDIDVLVPLNYLKQTAEILRSLGNIPHPIEYENYPLIHAMHCFDKNGVDVDLHWQAFFFQYYTENCVLEDPVFRQPFSLAEGNHTFILSDSFQLFHTIIHGLIGGTPTLRWIPDAYTILKKSNSIDIEAIVSYAKAQNVEFALQVGLALLAEHFKFNFTPGLLSDVGYAQKLYLRLSTQKPKNQFLFALNGVLANAMAYYLFVKKSVSPYYFVIWLSQRVIFRYKMRQ